jgi:hypothetical protein
MGGLCGLILVSQCRFHVHKEKLEVLLIGQGLTIWQLIYQILFILLPSWKILTSSYCPCSIGSLLKSSPGSDTAYFEKYRKKAWTSVAIQGTVFGTKKN